MKGIYIVYVHTHPTYNLIMLSEPTVTLFQRHYFILIKRCCFKLYIASLKTSSQEEVSFRECLYFS